MRPSKRSDALEAKFWSNVDFDPHDIIRCWPWRGGVQRGYGTFRFWDVHGVRIGVRAHRQAYFFHDEEAALAGMQLDHICHDPRVCQLGDDCPHRRCCNPHHLRLSTAKENCAPGRTSNRQRLITNCPHGHPYDAANTQLRSNGKRDCGECNRLRSSTYYHTYKSAAVNGPRPNAQSAKTHCPRNHPYDKTNTMLNSAGYRKCRECNRLRWRRTDSNSREQGQ